MLPGGGREEDEAEEACVAREVQEETALHVRVERLLFDQPAQPPEGPYQRWRTYLCTVISGEAASGGGEGANADLVDVTWLTLANDRTWPDDIRADTFLFPQLQAMRSALASNL